MSNENGFEFNGLFTSVEREFLPNEDLKKGQGIMLTLNLDLLTLEYMEHLEGEFNRIANEAFSMLSYVRGEDAELQIDEPADEAAKALAIVEDAAKAEGEKTFETDGMPPIELFMMEKARFRFWATALAGRDGDKDPDKRLLRDWSVVKDGKKVPVTYKILTQMPYHGLRKLYVFVIGEANNPTPSEKKA